MTDTFTTLAAERCIPMRGEEHRLATDPCRELVELLPGWVLGTNPDHIVKTYRTRDFHHTMAFVNAIAWIAHVEDHHPDMEIGYGHCRVRYNTHDVGGLSRNDFACAAKVELLFDQMRA